MISRKKFIGASIAFTAGAAAAQDVPVSAAATAPEPVVEFAPLSQTRIAAIRLLLPDSPRGFGPRCRENRAAWEALRTRPAFGGILAKAEALSVAPFPAWDDAAYLDFSRTGHRPRGEKMIGSRHSFLAPLVWAECLENKGRFVGGIEKVLLGYVAEPTWTLPAHDPGLKYRHSNTFFADLGASLFGAELAQTLYLLEGVVSGVVRDTVMTALETRVFAPMRASYQTGKGHWWLTSTNNWNAVCLAGVTNAALSVLPSHEDRAVFAAGAERYGRNSVIGFGNDGYCFEGLGYYNYGFGNYILLREALWQATNGTLDMFAPGKIRQIATYAPRLEIIDGIWPAIGDSHPGLHADAAIVSYCSRVLGLGLAAYEDQDVLSASSLIRGCMEAFPNSATRARKSAAAAEKTETTGPRSLFSDAGVLVLRPAPGSSCRMGAALKGGHNYGSHSHNDVGSFTIALGKENMIGDPGGPNAYNSKTFGPERYTAFKLFASYGHPVPLVAGKQQRYSADAIARVVQTDLADAGDRFGLDLAAAYPPGTLTRLVRTFRYDRTGVGALIVADDFAIPDGVEPSFESALTTRADWKQTAPDTLSFTLSGETLIAIIETPPAAHGFTVIPEQIAEDCDPFTRLGLRLNQPIAEGRVTITFRPAT